MKELPLADARILIVDDQEANVHLLKRVLQAGGYRNYLGVTDSRQVMELVEQGMPDLILLDLYMPYVNGFEIMEAVAARDPESCPPILVLTADITADVKLRALAAGARDFLTKPADNMEILARIRNLLETRFLQVELKKQNRLLESRLQDRIGDVAAAQMEMLERLARAAEFRDDDTGQHTQRVGRVSRLIALALGLPEAEAGLIGQAALLHDVGKIGIPDMILLKPGRLTPDEFNQMKSHTIMGAGVLSRSRFAILKLAEEIALSHHERWDGTGYPLGLAGEAIPLVGRIVACADTFDALIHERPYKHAWTLEEALAEMRRQAGHQFDPRVVEAFLSVVSEAVRTAG